MRAVDRLAGFLDEPEAPPEDVLDWMRQPPKSNGRPDGPDVPVVKYKRITAAELDAASYNVKFAIEGTLVEGQPCILAGGKQTLKTNVALDLAISLALADPFLGQLAVNRAYRVTMMSGEYGMGVIQETCRRVALSKGVKLSDVGGLIISPDLPKFGSLDHIDALRQFLTDDETEILILDPAYLWTDENL